MKKWMNVAYASLIALALSAPAWSQTAAPKSQSTTTAKKDDQKDAKDEKDAKGKFCGGHLKRWYYTTDVLEQACGDLEKAWGRDAEVYRCEHCKALYLPNPDEAGGLNVAGKGQTSVFGLTIPGKGK